MSKQFTLSPSPSPWQGEGSVVALRAKLEWEAA